MKIIIVNRMHMHSTRYRSLALKPRLHQGNMLLGNMLPVASLLRICCWIQRDTCCRDTGNMLPLVYGLKRLKADSHNVTIYEIY